MDLILLPRLNNNCQFMQSDFYLKLEKLFLWLEEMEQLFQLHVYIPANLLSHHSSILSFLKKINDNYQTQVSLIIELDKVNHTILSECYAKGLYHIVFLDREKGFKNLEYIQNGLNQFFIKKFKFYLWLERLPESTNYTRLRRYQQSEFIFEKIDFPPFTLDGLKIDPETLDDLTIPDELKIQKLSCRLFENTLTINFNGNIIPCPYYAGLEINTNLGNCSNDLPQNLITKKGIFSNTIHENKVCLLCNSLSRFYWHESKSHPLNQYFYEGKYQQANNEILIFEENSIHDEITESEPEQMEKALESFENRLKQWDEQMKQKENENDIN